MFKMKLFLILCVLLAVCNIVTPRPNKDKDPSYDDDDILNDEDGYGTLDEDDEEDDGDEDDETSEPPVIKTLPEIFSATVGSTVDLPCETENAESFSVMWQKNNLLIFQDKIPVGPKIMRYQRFENQTLHIEKVEASDDGEYECSVSTSPALTVKHKLIVLTPPRIVKITANNRPDMATVERGHELQLICVAEGTPIPRVQWSKDGQRVSAQHTRNGSSSILIQNVGRDDAGHYVCMADNSDNHITYNPEIKSVKVEVAHKPDVKLERIIVGESEVHLKCKVHAHPQANITWKKDDKEIKPNENILFELTNHHDHILKLLKIDNAQFGKYVCSAKNNYGHQEKHVFVSGNPTTPKFENQRFVGDNDDLKTKWSFMSMTPIKKVQIQYRKKGEGLVWNLEAPEVGNLPGFSHEIDHVLKHLKDGVYEARLRVENSYGWSEYSKLISLEGKPSVADSISKKEDVGIKQTDDTQSEPVSSINTGTRTLLSWPSVLLLITLSMYSSFV